MSKMVSIRNEPLTMRTMFWPKVVAIGISELRSAWPITACRKETPFATAVRM